MTDTNSDPTNGIDPAMNLDDGATDIGDVAIAGTHRLRIAVLIKQVPVAETLELNSDGRLIRAGVSLEMNAYCRRAVAKGTELAHQSGGKCTVFTLGPPSADDALREALAWGADDGVHICDVAFAGSDTLASSRALAAALQYFAPFDLILAGRNSIDGETGQVGPQVAELLDLAFASSARAIDVHGATLALELEVEDGSQMVDIDLPAVVSVAERLCEPCKVKPEGRAAVAPERIQLLTAEKLGSGPWGSDGSPTVVGSVRILSHDRQNVQFEGSLEEQIERAANALHERGVFNEETTRDNDSFAVVERAPFDVDHEKVPFIAVGVLVEHDRVELSQELVSAASDLAANLGGTVHVLSPPDFDLDGLARCGAQSATIIDGSLIAEDVSKVVAAWVRDERPSIVLAPSTTFGREVASRVAAATNNGLIGDAIALHLDDGRLIGAKPAFAGALVADIWCRSDVQFVTVRPGVLPIRLTAPTTMRISHQIIKPRGRVRLRSEERTHKDALNRASIVIGVGAGVAPEEYEYLGELASLLGAEIAATRKVTDKGWVPRSHQIGLTGCSISPRLYIAIGLSGKFNHMIGVRDADTVVAINADPTAPVFEHCDIGIVGDWHVVVPLLVAALREHPSSQVHTPLEGTR